MGIVDAFAEFGAKLANSRWAYSALANGQLIVSLWAEWIACRPEDGVLYRYQDDINRWSRDRDAGKNRFVADLTIAVRDDLPVRLIIATPMTEQDRKNVIEGKSATSGKKDFDPKKSVIGKIVKFEDGEVVIDFVRSNPKASGEKPKPS